MVLTHLNQSLNCRINSNVLGNLAELVLRRDEHQANTIPADLQERAVLPHEISLSVRQPRSTRQERLLLTGATAFLGSHILVRIHISAKAVSHTMSSVRLEHFEIAYMP